MIYMSKRVFLVIVISLYGFGAETLSKNLELNNTEKGLGDSTSPNVIMFFADDLGYGDLGISGHPTSRTPNIDALAQSGKFFTNFYVTSPICSPSRASLLTGRYQVRSGVYPGTFIPQSIYGLPKNETTMADILKRSGYKTQIIGKWHLGVGFKREFLPGKGSFGFDNFYGLPYSHDMCPCPVCFPNNDSCIRDCWGDGYVSCPLFSNKNIIEQPVYLPTLSYRFVDQALQFMKKSNEEGSPFFLYMAFHHIHHPQFASSKFHGKSDRGVTGDSLLELDWMVGEILSLLQKLELSNNTLTVFTSDNGPSLQRHQQGGCAGLLRCGKATTWEGGIRVPAIIHWPGKIYPGETNALASTLDLLPTITKLVGAHYENLALDGVDISPLLFDDSAKSPRKFFAIYPESPKQTEGPYAVIYKQYKAHFYTKGSDISDSKNYDPMCPSSHHLTKHDPPLLYDLYQDPGERYDQGNNSEYRVILETITKWRQKHMTEIQWMPPRTQIGNKRAEPCCTNPLCEPYPRCCDCPKTSYFQDFSPDDIYF